MKIDMYSPCTLQNKVCLEHMLKMAPSSIQAPLYASLQMFVFPSERMTLYFMGVCYVY
jgi:hypothetical protein